MEVTLFTWSYCQDMKKIITKSGIALNAGTLNRGFTVYFHAKVFMLLKDIVSKNYPSSEIQDNSIHCQMH
jgi:hypothetical protein